MNDKQVFRSTTAIVVWWVWVLFAVGNLIDLIVQGRDHESVVAAFILLLITGVVYVTALRPRVIADESGLTVANPVRDHRIDWAAIVRVDPVELLRIRCEWPDASAAGEAGTAERTIYSWAVHSARRKQLAAEVKAKRQAQQARGGAGGGLGGLFGMGGFGRPMNDGLSRPGGGGYARRGYAAPPPPTLGTDSDQVVTSLTERADQARAAAPDVPAAPPVSTWDRTAIAALAIPALALLIAFLA